MRAPFLVAALSLVGCAPHVPDGYFACDTGACPSGWFCRLDGFCYRTPSSSTLDGGTQLALYESCPVGLAGDATCVSGLCASGPDATATTGQCSTHCTSDASCPGAPNAWCVAGTCVATCQTSSTCGSGQGCYHLPGRTGKACFAVKNPRLGSTAGCTSSADCDPSTPCLRDPILAAGGVCSWVCDGSADACPLGAECVDVSALHSASPTGYACLAPCGRCPSGLTCAKFPSPNSRHCVPVGW